MPRYLQTNIQITDELYNSFDSKSVIERHIHDAIPPINIFEDMPERLYTDTLLIGYPDIESQNSYYEWACQGLELENTKILDTGCGRGDFFKFTLTKMNLIYEGIDTNQLLIEVGRNKYSNINISVKDWMDVNDDKMYDWIFNIFGISFKVESPIEYLKNTITHLLSLCNRGLILILMNSDTEYSVEHQSYKISEVVNALEQLNISNFGIDFTLNVDAFKVVIFR